MCFLYVDAFSDVTVNCGTLATKAIIVARAVLTALSFYSYI